MDTEVRLTKVEVKVESLDELSRINAQGIIRLENRVEQGFAEQRATIERGFAEVRREIRWMLGIMLTGITAILGILGRIGGLY